jgi:hypothetical protein
MVLDPTTNDDFTTLITGARIPDVDPGHECYALPNPPAEVVAGRNATLQISYVSDFDTDKNQTFYVCADIQYVLIDDFSYQVPCFNVSTEDGIPAPDDEAHDGVDDDEDAAPSATAVPGSSFGSASGSGGSGLSGGAIAGIVIGAIAGIALILGLIFFLWRTRQQRERLREQQASARAVKWNEGERSSAEGSKHDDRDVELRNL